MERGELKRIKLVLLILLIICILIQVGVQLYILDSNDVITGNVVTTGEVRICIGSSPEINLSNCNNNATQDIFYSCQLDSIPSNISNVTYSSEFTYVNRDFNSSNISLFEVSETGYLNFTPDNEDVGNYTIEFTISSNDACGETQRTAILNLTIINVNDAPIFIQELGDLTLQEGQLFRGPFLINHFEDPDEDNLVYNISGNSQIIITCGAFITQSHPNHLDTQVNFESEVCGITEYVRFTAIDPYNLTVNSNLMNITVNCDSSNPPGGGGGGGGSGGGSGSSTGEEIDRFRPLEPEYSHFQHEDCTENWNCTKWSECLPDNTMIRECVDLKKCGTTKYLPLIIKNCTYNGTCYDNIKNCHHDGCEENIDCGGPCDPCKYALMSPEDQAQRRKEVLMYVMGGLTLLLLAAGAYFHKELAIALYGLLSLMLKKKKKKQILIGISNKKRLLKKLKKLETQIIKKSIPSIFNVYSDILRDYLILISKNQLPMEFGLGELKDILNKKSKNPFKKIKKQISKENIYKELKEIFIEIYKQNISFEEKSSLISNSEMRLFIESMKCLIIQTSETEDKDLEREDIEIKINKNLTKENALFVNLTNIYIALEYLELEVVEMKYSKILAEYKNLSDAEKSKINKEIAILNLNIEYVKSWYETKEDLENLHKKELKN